MPLQFSVLVLVEFVALMVVAAPLVQVDAQVSAAGLCCPPCGPTLSRRLDVAASSSVRLTMACVEQMDGAVDEVFVNATPLHRIEPYIQRELNKLQLSVSNVSE